VEMVSRRSRGQFGGDDAEVRTPSSPPWFPLVFRSGQEAEPDQREGQGAGLRRLGGVVHRRDQARQIFRHLESVQARFPPKIAQLKWRPCAFARRERPSIIPAIMAKLRNHSPKRREYSQREPIGRDNTPRFDGSRPTVANEGFKPK